MPLWKRLFDITASAGALLVIYSPAGRGQAQDLHRPRRFTGRMACCLCRISCAPPPPRPVHLTPRTALDSHPVALLPLNIALLWSAHTDLYGTPLVLQLLFYPAVLGGWFMACNKQKNKFLFISYYFLFIKKQKEPNLLLCTAKKSYICKKNQRREDVQPRNQSRRLQDSHSR